MELILPTIEIILLWYFFNPLFERVQYKYWYGANSRQTNRSQNRDKNSGTLSKTHPEQNLIFNRLQTNWEEPPVLNSSVSFIFSYVYSMITRKRLGQFSENGIIFCFLVPWYFKGVFLAVCNLFVWHDLTNTHVFVWHD